MNLSVNSLLLWAHLLAMVGTFGGLFLLQVGIPASARSDEAILRRGLRFLSFLLLGGLVAGLALYMIYIRAAKSAGGDLPSQMHMLIGMKFVILFAVGGGLGAASAMVRKGAHAAANALGWVALILLAIASLLGVML